MSDGLQIALDTANSLINKLSERVGPEKAQYAQAPALAFGLLKAIMECPHCPGHFRVPVDAGDGREWVTCPNCGGYWVYTPEVKP